ncbi:hypothetical protein [Changchengzhania lutea]|uniref:hypothetical protein n=1 Tax=Changchengzhania lutea TaxID=2049305 RepID=UPI00115F74DA|nr:hypothetical protein [Changchengzhania lutea]
MVIINKYLVPNGYAAIALFPFIFFKKKEYINPVRLNHEKIHLRQQLELLLVFFFVWYFLDFLIKYLKYKNWNLAYRNIVFEIEAYKYQHQANYLRKRKPYAFLKL